MLASAIVLGVAAGLIFGGGRASRLAELRVAWWPLLAGAIAARLGAVALGDLALAAYLLGFAGIVAVAARNFRLPGMTLIAAGSALNLLVIALNGAMPVDPAALSAAGTVMPADPLHEPMDGDTRLGFLGDVIPIPVVRLVYSVGDVLIAAGGFWLPFAWLRRG
ncbi:MAG: DUF5317 family protein [Candidatus Limnocylindria bacterium]